QTKTQEVQRAMDGKRFEEAVKLRGRRRRWISVGLSCGGRQTTPGSPLRDDLFNPARSCGRLLLQLQMRRLRLKISEV
ncbi:hypothetical protein NQZ68_016191, partial [Dissostichus eleginoides]